MGDRVNPVLGFNENYKLKSDEIFLKVPLKLFRNLCIPLIVIFYLNLVVVARYDFRPDKMLCGSIFMGVR